MTINSDLIIQTAVKVQGIVGGGVVTFTLFGIPLSDWASITAIVTMTATTIIGIMAYRRGNKPK